MNHASFDYILLQGSYQNWPNRAMDASAVAHERQNPAGDRSLLYHN